MPRKGIFMLTSLPLPIIIMKLLESFPMKKRTLLKWLVCVPVTVSLLLGCSGKGKALKTIEGDPEILYKQALTRFNKRNYHDVIS